MKTIKALRQFSHYHAGNFDQGETRRVSNEAAEALVGMKLAEYVDVAEAEPKAPAKSKKAEADAKEKVDDK
ncbi:hypothetical protein [Pseudomonas sp. Marseille-Q5115]|uniref:hypothetical protein n=1 Tax=Pseudomonas sp. Marseille-Q5115 TaxID=2866593 RepID=UPI001CE4AF9E|nr:hypothetical protein [Pseudomonas sp. Marseille-Q5115]